MGLFPVGIRGLEDFRRGFYEERISMVEPIENKGLIRFARQQCHYKPIYVSVPLFHGQLCANGTVVGGLAQTVLANPDLTWEKTYMADVGVDFSLLGNRLAGSIDFYNKDTKGILISLPAPLEHGTSIVPNRNAGEVNNRGVEFDINWYDRIGKVGYR